MQIIALASMVAGLQAQPATSVPVVAFAPGADGPVIALADTGDADARDASSAGRPAVAAVAPFGAKDSWRWQLTASWMGNANDTNQIEGAWSASWFFMQDVSVDFGLSGDAFLQPGVDAGGGGAALGFTWHFIARADWSLFADAGCGMLFTNEPVPDDGGRVNFTPRAGLGATIAVSESVRVVGGARWYHISNANTGQSNPGWNALQVYGGVSMPF